MTHEMNDDEPVHIGRVIALEASLDEMRDRHDATHELLRSLVERLGPAQAQNAQSPTRRTPSTTNPSASRRNPSLKPALPPDFSGDRKTGKAFLTSCRTYMRLCPEAFEDDEMKIVWAMSYMKSGRASRWATREFELEAKTSHLRFIDWFDFEEEFRRDFLPLDAEAAAVNTLETSAYFQGKRSVDDYLDAFRDLIEDSGYTDPKTVVVKFRRGLDRRIATALAGMASGRPSDTDPNAWYRLAVQMDQNRAADEAFQASHKSAYVAPTSNVPTKTSTPSRSVFPSRFAHASPTPGNPVPMDIDAATKAKALSDACRRCGKTGHWAKDCERRFDVRFMEDDEIQKQLEDRLAARDVAEANASNGDEVLDTVDREDFVPRSG
jgi:hypothetical protein